MIREVDGIQSFTFSLLNQRVDCIAQNGDQYTLRVSMLYLISGRHWCISRLEFIHLVGQINEVLISNLLDSFETSCLDFSACFRVILSAHRIIFVRMAPFQE
ncbi:uncharacterized protein PHALS_08988 [Plasmopara halstedii]|uniref:Uncharacterized protein n=1 Tax=Plasmopara halstedii TaxID=4781 RepID=A0A0P1AEK7_PLAHL|nr:uncharacterized protein PHALS_08988 [Plasmopara halstedii]CEG38944.1 hypothetical protein PHALS_08988 [Plasmopara halstedii]|eukprot:XP_024575313.1 hypothetical protein PHALS_08988 [Plasmopara halstedii]